MSFDVAQTNKILLEYRTKLDNYEAHKETLVAAREAYQNETPGSSEYFIKRNAYFELIGQLYPLPVKQYESNVKIDYKKQKSRLIRQRKVKKPANANSKSNSNSVSKPNTTNVATKQRILEEALQATFRFKSLEECVSRKKGVSITKTDLLEAIQGNPVLAHHVGKIPKSISKEELCERLFKKT